MKRTSVAIFALLSAIAPASAADLYGNSTKDPFNPSLGFVPTGFYVNIGVGGAITDTSAQQGTLNPDFGFSGFLGNVRVGYDMRSGNWVAGPLVGVSFEDVKGKVDLQNKVATGSQVLGYELGARLGYTLGNSLVYALVAYQGQHIGLDNTSLSADLSGLKVGGGLEVTLPGSNWSIGSEVSYVDFGDWNGKGSLTIPATFSETEVRATINTAYHF